MHCTGDKFYCSYTVLALFIRHLTTLLKKKKKSHDTINTFKNYFVTVFFSFQLCPNGPLMNFTLFHVYPKKEKKKNLLCSNKWFY